MKRKMPRRFAEGGSDKYQSRYDRKVKDIESDYAKALKSGKNADIAKAKLEQRMADAKDDLAKWTKADRSVTSAAEKAAEAALSEARRTRGASMRSAPEVQTMSSGPLDVAPMGRMPKLDLPDVSGGRRPTASHPKAQTQRSSASDSGDISVTGRRMKDDLNKLYGGDYAAAIRRAGANRTTNVANPNMASARSSSRPIFGRAPGERAARLEEMRVAAEAPGASRLAKDAYRMAVESGMYRKGGSVKKKPMVKKYAKGGSVDGCAVRGKTRAPMKRGK